MAGQAQSAIHEKRYGSLGATRKSKATESRRCTGRGQPISTPSNDRRLCRGKARPTSKDWPARRLNRNSLRYRQRREKGGEGFRSELIRVLGEIVSAKIR